MDIEGEENVENDDIVSKGVELENTQLINSTVVFITDKVFVTHGDLLKRAK